MYFVTPVPRRGNGSFVVPQDEISTVGFDALAAVFPNAMTRCKECGCTIAQHPTKEERAAVAANALFEEVREALIGCRQQRWLYCETAPKRVGRGGFDRAVVERIQKLDNALSPNGLASQSTFALVLKCTSGVGKTLATLTARCKVKKDNINLVTLYIGLNAGWELSVPETSFLERHPEQRQYCIEVVLLWRTIAASVATLGVLDNIDDPSSDVQRAPLPSWKPRSTQDLESMLTRRDVLWGMAVSNLAALMTAMPATSGTRAVLLALDEGHFLDKMYPGGPAERSGAQYALKTMRQLQQSVATHGHVLVPIMTGINPSSYEYDPSVGRNAVIGYTGDEALITVEDMRVVALQRAAAAFERLKLEAKKSLYYTSDASNDASTDDQRLVQLRRELLVLSAWPRVRQMVSAIDHNCDLELSLDGAGLVLGPKDKRLLLIHGWLEKDLDLTTLDDRSSVERYVPLRYTTDATMAIPVLDSVVWPRIDCTPIPVPSLSTTETMRPIPFEMMFGSVAGFFLRVYGPLLGDPLITNAPSAQGLLRWLDLPQPVNGIFVDDQGGAEQIEGVPASTRHNDQWDCLSPYITRKVIDLKQQGENVKLPCAMWVASGEDSPLDFLLLGLTSPNEAFVRFVDAKHSADPQLTHANDTYCELVNKAHSVHTKLMPLLKEAFNIELSTFDPVHVALATNRPGTTVSLPRRSPSRDVRQTAQPMIRSRPRSAFVFAPDTFVLRPWTSFLFSDVLISPPKASSNASRKRKRDGRTRKWPY